MAKRSNPFVEDFIPQSKVHVGLKQFNNNEHRLQKVYEKTLELLFRGAKKPTVQDFNTANAVCNKRDKLKQLHIEKDGSLTTQGLLIESTIASDVKCSCGSNIVETKCAYCERILCAACQQSCVRCDQTYCCNCCIRSETSVCVSCYS